MKNKRKLSLTGLAAVLASLLLVQLARAQDYVWASDFPVGAAIAAIDAPDQNGERKTFADLVGENGLLLMFSRSFDW